MLDPSLWVPRFTVLYNTDDRSGFNLLWQHQSRLTRIDITTTGPLKDTWNKGGDIDRMSEGRRIGQTRYIPWGSSYQVWAEDDFYPYTLRWKPVSWFPDGGKVQFWEYNGPISRADLLHYLQLDSSNPNSDLIIQIETLRNLIMQISAPGGSSTSTTAKTEIKQELATMIEALPANPTRNGGIIQNNGKNKLFLGFGVNADKGSKLFVLPGGQASIESNFVGVINCMWDAVDPVAGSSSRAIFTEFVA
jgi:hypothetical protein